MVLQCLLCGVERRTGGPCRALLCGRIVVVAPVSFVWFRGACCCCCCIVRSLWPFPPGSGTEHAIECGLKCMAAARETSTERSDTSSSYKSLVLACYATAVLVHTGTLPRPPFIAWALTSHD